jgi:two-component system phosphate regulon response regulator OmpR
MAAPVVVIVEDNSELRHVLKEALGGEGYLVHAVRDETEALELLRASRVDLLITDLSEPGSPRDLDAVRQEFPKLPVVALSDGARSHPTLFFAGWQQPKGFRALPKPFRLGELLAVSREVLRTNG